MNLDYKLIKELENFPWFQNCGNEIKGNLDFSVSKINNWDEFKIAFNDADWINLTEDANGNLTEYLSYKCPNEYQGVWNKMIKEARLSVASFLEPKAIAFSESNNLGNAFVDGVKWEVLNGIMEHSYLAKNPPLFFRKLLEIYKLGHCPCGFKSQAYVVF